MWYRRSRDPEVPGRPFYWQFWLIFQIWRKCHTRSLLQFLASMITPTFYTCHNSCVAVFKIIGTIILIMLLRLELQENNKSNYEKWDGIAHQFPHFKMDVITYQCLDYSQSMLIKGPLDEAYMHRWIESSVSEPMLYLRIIQYIPRNMHTVLLCFALLWLCNRS